MAIGRAAVFKAQTGRKGKLVSKEKALELLGGGEPPTEKPEVLGLRICTTTSMLYPLLKAAESYLKRVPGGITLEVRDDTGGRELSKVRQELEKLASDYGLTVEFIHQADIERAI